MVRLKCADCGAGVSKADVFCRSCGSSLLEEDAVIAAPDTETAPAEGVPTVAVPVSPGTERPADQEPPGPERADGRPATCPHCGADIPDPRHLVCVQCLTELKPPDRQDGPPGDSSLRAGAADSYATVREGDGTRLMVRFDFGVIELLVGQEMMLGRDASDHRLAPLRSRDNVSRTHATVGLSPDGAWIRDENSTNGTFINGRRVAAGDVVELPEGAELRLASNIRATVQLREA